MFTVHWCHILQEVVVHQIFSLILLTANCCCSCIWQSDCFYNGGWTEDIRKVVEHIHQRYPEAPLFVVGTSLGANIVVSFR